MAVGSAIRLPVAIIFKDLTQLHIASLSRRSAQLISFQPRTSRKTGHLPGLRTVSPLLSAAPPLATQHHIVFAESPLSRSTDSVVNGFESCLSA